MVVIYLIVAWAINIGNDTAQVIEGVNIIFDSGLNGTEIFWWGLLVSFILGLITR